MNRKNSKKNNQLTPKAAIFWGSILLITLAFFIGIGIKWVQSSQVITSYKGMMQLEGEELFRQYDKTKDGVYTYYVFVYDSDSEAECATAVEDLEEHICNYLTFVKKNKNAEGIIPLYGLNLDRAANNVFLSSTSENITTANHSVFRVLSSSLPLLIKVQIKVENGETTVSNQYQYKDSNAIKEILQRQIEKLS